MKLSFSLSSAKPSSSSAAAKPPPPPPSFTDDHPASSAAPRPEFVTVFDPSKTLDPTPRRIIPPLPNTSLFGRSTKPPTTLPTPSSPSDPLRFVLDSAASPSSPVSYGLTLRRKPQQIEQIEEEEEEEPVRRLEPAVRPFSEDIHSYPDDRGADEFADISVDDFAEALLAGLGWSKGQGIGFNNTKGDTKVVQAKRRAINTAGLGYVPVPGDPSRPKRKRGGTATDL